jgi:hypothetical protein
MAEAELRTESVCAKPTGSLIMALHARYEASWEEYNRLDVAQLALNDA